MERSDALRELAAKVEAGEVGFEGFCPLWHDAGLCVEAENAYNGSLDAAKALHEAVLPGWSWAVYPLRLNPKEFYANVTNPQHTMIWDSSPSGVGVYPNNPSRAWLLAILRALIAKEGK